MRLLKLSASTAALILSSSALFAQEATTSLDAGTATPSNVYIDVGGTVYYVPAALAAEACGQDVAAILETAQTRMEESGMDPSMMGSDAAAGMADPAAATTGGAMDSANATTDATAGADPAAGTATADAGAEAQATDDMAATDMATADAGAATDQGGAATTEAGTDIETADSGAAMTDTLEGAETTAADASGAMDGAMGGDMVSEAGAEYLAVAVCQVDAAQAATLGIQPSGEASQ